MGEFYRLPPTVGARIGRGTRPAGSLRRVTKYLYPPFSVTADVAVFCTVDGDLQVLLIRRGKDPYGGCWALPGGFVDIDEDLDDAARRELEEETGLSGIEVRQLGAYGAPDRDPRGRTVSIAYAAVLPTPVEPTAGDDAAAAVWRSVADVLADGECLAFDHDRVLQDALASLA